MQASTSYYTPHPTPAAPYGIKHLLAHLELLPTHTSIPNPICLALHPSDPSCTRNYIQAIAHESAGVVKWVAGFEALNVLLKKSKQKKTNEDASYLSHPLPANQQTPTNSLSKTLKPFFLSSLLSTLFIAGSISTSWASTCLFAHTLPNTLLPRARFFLNGLLGSTWIFILPAGRRAEISMYVLRVTLVNVWNLISIKARGSRGKVGVGRMAEVTVFAMGWVGLLGLVRRGYRVDGVSAKVLGVMDGSSQ